MTVCAALTPSTTSIELGVGVALDDRERDRTVGVVPADRRHVADDALTRANLGAPRTAGHDPSRRRGGRRGAAAGGRGCARGRRSPARGSSPCAGAPPCAASRPRGRSCGGRSRAPSRGRQAAIRSASAAQRPASGRSPTAATRSARGTMTSRHAPLAAGVVLDRTVRGRVADEVGPWVAPGERLARRRTRLAWGSPSTAQSAVTSATSTRSMKRILSSHSRSASAGARLRRDPRRLAVVDEVERVLDVALGSEDQGLARLARPEVRARCWVVSECSQLQPVGAA